MNTNLLFKTLAIALLSILLTLLFMQGCQSAKREGNIVKDQNGKYYLLTNERVLGNERYRLIEIDTANFRPF